jgi:hypothetical protein
MDWSDFDIASDDEAKSLFKILDTLQANGETTIPIEYVIRLLESFTTMNGRLDNVEEHLERIKELVNEEVE